VDHRHDGHAGSPVDAGPGRCPVRQHGAAARRLVVAGVLISPVDLFAMSRFNLYVDFRTALWSRIIQSAGMAFLFVPISAAAYRAAHSQFTQMLHQKGASLPDAAQQAHGIALRQSSMPACADAFWVMAVLLIAIIPMMFMMRKSGPARGPVMVE
jgi:hypothetical protein